MTNPPPQYPPQGAPGYGPPPGPTGPTVPSQTSPAGGNRGPGGAPGGPGGAPGGPAGMGPGGTGGSGVGAPGSTAPKRRGVSTGQVLGGLLLVLTVIFIFENMRSVKVRLIFPEVKAPLALPIVIAAVLGGLIAWLLRYRRQRHHGGKNR